MVDTPATEPVDGPEPPLLISLHMPKTAGISFGSALQEHFAQRYLADYSDFPLNTPLLERHRRAIDACLHIQDADFQEFDCIHGHFLPVKYLLLADRRPCRFIAWVREPVARLVSHYHYWFDVYDPHSPDTRELHRRVVEEQWPLERFCLCPELRNVYSQFLWGFPLEQFAFIGITEHFESDLRELSAGFLDGRLPARSLNQRQSREVRGREAELSGSQRRRVEEWHAADMAVYRRALAIRSDRLATR
jgi:hypothetical protein